MPTASVRIVSMLAALVLGTIGHAANTTASIIYSPSSQTIQGNEPLLPGNPAIANNPYTLKIKAPNSSAPVTYPFTVNLSVEVILDAALKPLVPPGVDPTIAVNFAQVSPATLQFTRPNEELTTQVSVTVPLGSYAGNYAWLVKGNWPFGVIDRGATINATVLPAPTPPTIKPIANISYPADGQIFVYKPAEGPVTFTIDYSATVPAGGGPLTGLLLVFDNKILAPLSDSKPVLGGMSASGRANSPALTDGGPHTIKAIAQNNAGEDTRTIMINVHAPALIVTHPLSQTVYVDDPVTFQATAKGYPAPSLQWQKVEANITGANSGTYTIAHAALTDAGLYRMVAANTYGTANSNYATLTVLKRPQTIAFTDPLTKTYGDASFSLSATASSGLPVSYTSSNPSVASVNGTTVTIHSAGTTTIIASQPGNATKWLAAPDVSRTLTVNPAPLTVRADDKTKNVNDLIPPLTLTYFGFVNGETPATAFSALPLPKTQATPSSPAGTYQITVEGGVAPNYTITRINGLLTVLGATEEVFVGGFVFFDANSNASYDTGDPVMDGVTVELRNASNNNLVASTVTVGGGAYALPAAANTTYRLSVIAPTGFTVFTMNPQTVPVGTANFTASPSGLKLNFAAIRNLTAQGMSHGFWKTNLEKALSGKKSGVQVTYAQLDAYTDTIATFALNTPQTFGGVEMLDALKILKGQNGQLALQLLASEYNFARGVDLPGAYIGGNRALTDAFLRWGEATLVSGTAAQKEFAKDWFDAYNNSHGGKVQGPLP